MKCLIIAKNSQVIKDNLADIFPHINFETCSDLAAAAGRYDIVLLSRFLCDRKKLPGVALKFALARIVLLVGDLDEDCRAYLKAAKNSGLTDYVSGKLPGDRPYTLLQALAAGREEVHELEEAQEKKQVNLLKQETVRLETPKQEEKLVQMEQGETLAQKQATLMLEIESLRQEIAAQKNLKLPVCQSEKQIPAMDRKSTLVIVAANKGGVGKTTTTATLAIALANAGVPVTVVDLDFRGANISVFFGLTPAQGIDSLCGHSGASLEYLVPRLLVETRYRNLKVFPGVINRALAPREMFTAQELLAIINLLKSISPVVVVDTPPGFWVHEYLFDTFVSSDMLLAVVDQSSFSKDDVKSYAPYLFSMGVSPEKIKIVLNRFSPKLSRAREIEKFFAESVSSKEKPRIIATIPNDWDAHIIKSSRSEAVGLEDSENQWHQVAAEVAARSGFHYGQKVNHKRTLKEILKPNLMSLWKK